jgi:hypothetical protein
MDLNWMDDEVQVYEGLKALAKGSSEKLPIYVKKVLKKHSRNIRPA